jgi:DNA-binding NarL/FixJ family response regulator
LRIVLVDSSEVFRMGMRALLAEARDLVVVGEAADGEGAIAAVRSLAPELVVTDLDLPDQNAVALATALRELAPATRVLVLAPNANEVSVRQTLVAGVSGYVLKTQPPHEILAALFEVAAGRRVEAPAVREIPAADDDAELPRASRAAVLARLSAREREIFDLIIWGQTNKQVAIKLGISVKTVETHRSHINGKLQVHSAAELVRLASLCGALTTGDSAETASTSLARAPRDKPSGKTVVGHAALPQLIAKIG